MKAFEILSSIYPEEINFLHADTPFQFLVCVCLSAQTTDASVMRVAPSLFSLYPHPASLSAADAEEVGAIIRPLGFWRTKAKNIIGLAHAVDEMGYIPSSIEELIKLPGVGRKTANCYVHHICGAPAVIVDTHFKRVAARLGYTSETDPDRVELDIKSRYPEEIWSRMSMVLNLHGRKYCFAKNPDCDHCPVASYCTSRKPS